MRCDTKIYFVTDGEKTLITDPSASNYGDYEAGAPAEVSRFADVTDTQTNTQQLVYGALREGSRTVRLNEPYREAFDNLRGDHLTFARRIPLFLIRHGLFVTLALFYSVYRKMNNG